MATTAIGVTAARELDELYRRHAAEVFRYAYAVLGNRADAEDITQTTFVNALRALERGEKPRKPTNWLITIAHNLIRQRFRQQQTRPREVELDRDVPVLEDADDGPSIDDLVRALQKIPPTQRQALVLRELEGRPYGEIAELLGVSQSALEALIFRARSSLAEELENLVTCDRAELALSRAADGRLGRKERRRLLAHLDECTSCARVAAKSLRYRRAFKALAVLPLPLSLTLFKGAPSAAAATGLPMIGAGSAATAGAAGLGAAGVTTKIAIGLAAVGIAGGAGYEGVKAVQEPARQVQPAARAVAAPIPQAKAPTTIAAATPSVANVTAVMTRKPSRAKAATMGTPKRGRSASAPGHTKTETRATPTNAKSSPRPKPTAADGRNAKVKQAGVPKAKRVAKGKPATTPKAKVVRVSKPTPTPARPVTPAVEPVQGKSAVAPGQLRKDDPAKTKPESKNPG